MPDCCICSSNWELTRLLLGFYSKLCFKYLEPELIAFLDQLVGPGNQVEAVDVAEVVGDLGAEYPACTPGVDGPIFNIFRI